MSGMDRKTIEEHESDDSSSSSDDKTYHFRKGSDLDGFESFGALFADGLFTDLAICCGGRVFRCHRVVMAASSAYIKNALSAFQNSSHNNCNTILILPNDIKVQDMEAILHFIYNGQVEVTRDAIESFLSSAKTLHIKGLANIKLVYNNSASEKRNRSSTTSALNKALNNENENNNSFNNFNNCNDNENNERDSPSKRRNGLIGTTAQQNRSPKLKTDLNFNSFVENIPQNQSFHSSQPQQTPQELDSKTSQSTARRKQKLNAKSSPTNGFANNTKDTNGNGNWITIEDEEEAHETDSPADEEGAKNGVKVEDNDSESVKEKSGSEDKNGTDDSGPAMPCLIQIDADPTTFPSFCSENNDSRSAKRRRSSSARLESKAQKKDPNSLVKLNRSADLKPQMRSSNRKLGFIGFHKKAPALWNSSNKWKCEICNKLYGNKQTLKEHMDYFHSNRAEQIFTCDICAKEYTWKKSLMKHYRDIHQINNASLSQMMASTPKTGGAGLSEVPALEWVTQSQDNSSQSK